MRLSTSLAIPLAAAGTLGLAQQAEAQNYPAQVTNSVGAVEQAARNATGNITYRSNITTANTSRQFLSEIACGNAETGKTVCFVNKHVMPDVARSFLRINERKGGDVPNSRNAEFRTVATNYDDPARTRFYQGGRMSYSEIDYPVTRFIRGVSANHTEPAEAQTLLDQAYQNGYNVKYPEGMSPSGGTRATDYSTSRSTAASNYPGTRAGTTTRTYTRNVGPTTYTTPTTELSGRSYAAGVHTEAPTASTTGYTKEQILSILEGQICTSGGQRSECSQAQQRAYLKYMGVLNQ